MSALGHFGDTKICATHHILNRVPKVCGVIGCNDKSTMAVMTNLRTFFVIATSSTLIATFAPAQSFAVPGYDGSWSVLVMTQKGDCDPAYRYPIRVTNGTLVNAGGNAFTITGKIAQTGAITVTISAGGKSATGVGHLAGAEGSGTWIGGSCSGSWTAERRNSNSEGGSGTPPSW
jgi:hypothetical protein